MEKDVNSRNPCNSKTEKKISLKYYKNIIFYDDQLNPIPIYDGNNYSQGISSPNLASIVEIHNVVKIYQILNCCEVMRIIMI